MLVTSAVILATLYFSSTYSITSCLLAVALSFTEKEENCIDCIRILFYNFLSAGLPIEYDCVTQVLPPLELPII